ncbi:MAG: hypothetical protein K1X61_11505 [Chitinophagales bacterium]|nr:hypothetical protein [Chitinophagales bacterium]
MAEKAKIILSKDEIEAVSDRSFFETKIRITQKIYHAFANCVSSANEQAVFEGIDFPTGTDSTTGKISKGENHLGLPYILLDFPRYFKGNESLAIRTMFWWGKFISCALFVAGKPDNRLQHALLRHHDELSKKRTWICVHDSPWLHHFGKDNYRMMRHFSGKELTSIMHAAGFIKVARKIPVSGINQMEGFILESFLLYARLLRHTAP